MNFQKNYTINMPQMAIEALSESWLFKELGDTHWEMLCKGLETKSYNLTNDTNDRLYATFVRLKIRCSKNLKAFKENDTVDLSGKMTRFGNNMYFSDINFETKNGQIDAKLMTAFSIRNEYDNTKLSKSEPNTAINHVENLAQLPKIGNEYRQIKKGMLTVLEDGDYSFNLENDDNPIFTTDYEINPFYDLNGVNLLYFAAYPIINDVCEARYFNKLDAENRWEQNYFTAYKDVLYYANCNYNDSLVYKLLSVKPFSENAFLLSSMLSRKSDGAQIARIFSVKSKLK